MVSPFHKFGTGLLYQDTLDLGEAWAFSELDLIHELKLFVCLRNSVAKFWCYQLTQCT